MTKVRLHGILGQEFGKVFRFHLDKPKQVIDAIDACRRNFNNRINELAKEGCHYTILVDRKKISSLSELEMHSEAKIIDLVPAIAGAAGAIGAVILGFIPGLSAAAVGGFAATLVGSVVLTAVSVGLQLLLTPKPDAGPPISATTKALQESFLFSNKANIASQGAPLPVGYGRLKVGSQVVQYCNKSFPQNRRSTTAMLANPFLTNNTDDNPAVTDTRV